VPAELRERWQLHPGARLLLIETADGIVLATREQVKQLVRSQLAGTSLAKELISERRAEAAREAAS
jgi:bifunctional DNA-binding transcriptional regulator/antitoxin component of YhaV-PrlF toxin-antitoxin module